MQSNVTARIRQLEDELGRDLFRRHARGVELTSAGHRLLPYAQRVARLLEDARSAVQDDGKPQGPLVIGALETSTALRLSRPLTAYVAAYPDVDLTLRTGTTCELIDQVLDHRLEGAFVCGPVAHPDLHHARLHRGTRPAHRALDRLAGCAYPARRRPSRGAACWVFLRQRLEELFTRRGVAATRVLEFGTVEALFGCVAANLGVTLLPRGLVGAGRGGQQHRPRAAVEHVGLAVHRTCCTVMRDPAMTFHGFDAPVTFAAASHSVPKVVNVNVAWSMAR